MHTRVIVAALAAVFILSGAAGAPASDPPRLQWTGQSSMRAGRWKATARFVRFSGNPVAALADEILHKDMDVAMQTFVSQSRRGAGKQGNPTAAWEYQADTMVSVAKSTLISAYATSYWYTGGAHGMTYFTPVNAGLVDGQAKELTLEDLFQPGVGARWRCALAVKARLRDMPQALWFKPDADPSMKPIDSDLIRQFILTPTSFVFIIDQYIAGPYSSGPIFVKIPYTAFGAELNADGPLKPLLGQ
jgi:hypothetical protein